MARQALWRDCLVPVMALVLAGCAPATDAAGEPTTSEVSRGPGECPASTFRNFVLAFSESADLQRRHTSSWLLVSRLIEGRAEPRTVTRRVSAASLVFPVMPGGAQRRELGLQLRIVNGREPVAVIEKPDTDYKVTYRFARGSCWVLIRQDDQSL